MKLRTPALIGIALVAAAIGAYLDWLWWHPTQGILITLAALGALLIAGVLALARTVRGVAAVGLAIGVGLLLGQNLGPARETPQTSQGRLELRLEGSEPIRASGRATCNTASGGAQLQVSGDPGIRLQTDHPAAERPFIEVSVARGDLFDAPLETRDDRLSVWLSVSSPIERAGATDRLTLASDRSSDLVAEVDGLGGTLRFASLALVSRSGDVGVSQDVTGTVEWNCSEP